MTWPLIKPNVGRTCFLQIDPKRAGSLQVRKGTKLMKTVLVALLLLSGICGRRTSAQNPTVESGRDKVSDLTNGFLHGFAVPLTPN